MRIAVLFFLASLLFVCWAAVKHLALIPLISHENTVVLRPLEQLRLWDLFRRSGPRLLAIEKLEFNQVNSKDSTKALFETFMHSKRERGVEKSVNAHSFNKTMTFWRQGGHKAFHLHLPVHLPVSLLVKTSSYPKGFFGLEIERGIPVESQWIDGAVEIEYQPVHDWTLLSRRGDHMEINVPVPADLHDNRYLNSNSGLLIPYRFKVDRNEGK